MMFGDGRPLRFLALVGCGWTAVRLVLAFSATGSLPDAVREIIPLPIPAVAATTPAAAAVVIHGARGSKPPPMVSAQRWPTAIVSPDSTAFSPVIPALPPPAPQHAGLYAGVLAPAPMGTAAPLQDIPSFRTLPRQSPLSISSWAIVRGGTGLGASALSPQLGGTQGGIRVDYSFARGLAATARIAAPAAGAGREVSLGIAWRPASVPLRLVAEQRIAIDGGRGGPAIGVSGGVSDMRLPVGFALDGYAQAGAIARDGIETYVDASARAARPIATLGSVTVDAGGGAWGGAQRGVARLDLGPSIGLRVPVAGRPVRIALDWRQRIAGNARPGSGPALTIGTDF